MLERAKMGGVGTVDYNVFDYTRELTRGWDTQTRDREKRTFRSLPRHTNTLKTEES